MSPSLISNIKDLAEAMPKPRWYGKHLRHENLAAKQDYFKDSFSAQHSQNPQLDVGIDRTLPAQFPKLKMLTMKRIATLHRMKKAKAKKRGFEHLSENDEPSAFHISADGFRTSNAKRGRFEENRLTRIEGRLKEVLHLSGQSDQAFRGQLYLGETGSRDVYGHVVELGSLSKKETNAADTPQPRSTSASAILKVELNLKANRPTLTQRGRPNIFRPLQGQRKTPPSARDGDSLRKKRGHAKTQESGQAVAEDTQHCSPQILLVRQAAALRANRDKVILLHNSSQPNPKKGGHTPRSTQNMHGSQNHTARTLHLFLTTVTEAWSGVSFQTHRNNICKELQRQQSYIWQILSMHQDSRSLSMDAQATVISRIATQMLVDFEKTWTENHPGVTVPAIQNVLHRQIAYLALDVAIKCGYIAHVDEASLMSHIAAVQTQAKSRQLIILKGLTESLRRKAQITRSPVAQFQDHKTTLAPSVNPRLKQASLVRHGLSKSSVQNCALVIDEVTGVASVMQVVDPGKHTAPRSTAGRQMKSFKLDQDIQTSASQKSFKTTSAREGANFLNSRGNVMTLESLIQNSAARGGSEKTYNDVENLFHNVEPVVQPHGTVNPMELLKTFPVSSITTFASKLVSNTPATNERMFTEVMEFLNADSKNFVSGEERTRDLLRHREAYTTFLGERSPAIDIGVDSVGVDDFFYATSVEFDSFGFDD